MDVPLCSQRSEGRSCGRMFLCSKRSEGRFLAGCSPLQPCMETHAVRVGEKADSVFVMYG